MVYKKITDNLKLTNMTDIDIVVGRGPIGSATARQFAKAGTNALIGPTEPEDYHKQWCVWESL